MCLGKKTPKHVHPHYADASKDPSLVEPSLIALPHGDGHFSENAASVLAKLLIVVASILSLQVSLRQSTFSCYPRSIRSLGSRLARRLLHLTLVSIQQFHPYGKLLIVLQVGSFLVIAAFTLGVTGLSFGGSLYAW